MSNVYKKAELRQRAMNKYRALSQPQRQKAIAHIRKKEWSTNFSRMNRRQLEQITAYLESL